VRQQNYFTLDSYAGLIITLGYEMGPSNKTNNLPQYYFSFLKAKIFLPRGQIEVMKGNHLLSLLDQNRIR
jgi:hypothetical protein